MTAINPATDLVLERFVDVPPELVYEAWTTPEHIMHWFTPAPWKTVACELDLRPGGKFNSVMLSPEGQEFPNFGCVLEAIPNRKLVFTDTLTEGYRPSANPFFVATVEIIPEGTGTRYRATAVHKDEETRKKHEDMGFHEGWGKALEQLVEYAKTKMGK
ncbi:MAG TPA: SRPBCC family protein [Fibrobacteria bacterium]|jgi:uncharacterized protein YndB with AHSA1/START domain|nr:SRPBCC family protein [Fibrobacteria bacterium]